MQKIIIAFMIIGLLLVAGCNFETAEEKAARIEREKARQAELEREKAEYEKRFSMVVDRCSTMQEDNNTFCFAEEAVKFKDNGKEVVNDLCPKANNTDLCYFYVAVVAKDRFYCSKISKQDQVGCGLAASSSFCNSLSNKYDCLEGRAEVLYFLDRQHTKVICNMLKASRREFSEDSVCIDIDLEDEEYNSEFDLRTRVILTFIVVKLGEYEIRRVRY